jgi:hypothetical protein
VNRERAVWLGAAVTLLIVGLSVGRLCLPPADGIGAGQRAESAAPSFRQWFWESRSLDLAAQVGLIFVGALGIAALLPRGEEEP